MKRITYSIIGAIVLMLLVGSYYILNKDTNDNSKVENTYKEDLEQTVAKSKSIVARKEFRNKLLKKGELSYYKTKKKLPAYRVTITDIDENYKYLSESLGLDFTHIDSSIPLDDRHLAWVAKLLAVSQTWNLNESKLRGLIGKNQLMLDLFNQIQIKYLSNEIGFEEFALAVKKLMLWNEAYYMKELTDQQFKELNFGTSKDDAPQAIESILTPPITELTNMFPAFEKDFKENKDILSILTQEQLDKLVIAEKAKWLKEITLNTKLDSGEITQEQYSKEKTEDIKLIEDAKMAVVGKDIYNKYLNPNSDYIGSNIQGEPPPGVLPENYKDYIRHSKEQGVSP